MYLYYDRIQHLPHGSLYSGIPLDLFAGSGSLGACRDLPFDQRHTGIDLPGKLPYGKVLRDYCHNYVPDFFLCPPGLLDCTL